MLDILLCMKLCAGCDIERELAHFSKNKRMTDGLQQRCKICCKEYRDKNKEKNKSEDFSHITHLECTECSLTKEILEFSPKINSPRGFDYWCKKCRRKYAKYYRDEDLDFARADNNQRRHESLQWLSSLKANTLCFDCDKIYETFCMDYDHIPERGIKVKAITRMVLDNASEEAILKEIEKCQLVCCLCHNIRTQRRLDIKFPNKGKDRPAIVKNIEIINQAKNIPCNLCGIQREPCNMQFDHVDPANKVSAICNMKSCEESILLAEIAKCQIICALCHRRKSILEQREGKYPKNREQLVINKPTPQVEVGFAWCSKCEIAKLCECFASRSDTNTGYNAWCKECFNEYRR